MTIALSEFWTRLVQNGVADTDQCKRFAAAYCDAHQGAPATDADSIAAFLLISGKLTKFQSTSLLSESPVSLRLGNFVQMSNQPAMPLGHWLPVQTVAGGLQRSALQADGDSERVSDETHKGFLLRVPGNQLNDLMSQWLAAHAAVTHRQLQAFQLLPDGQGGMAIFSELGAGRSLAELTKKKMKVARAQALSLSISIADSMSAMHAAALVHGEVRADRIWMTSGGKATLLRDPSGPARVPRADPAYGWIHATESAGDYAAPEFADPSQPCTVASDIYSLGCLMFRMFVGRMPMDGANASAQPAGTQPAGTQPAGTQPAESQQSIEQQIASHATHVPSELTQAIELGEAGDPVLRVIAYAMAKSPAARFTSVQQVADALTAVQASLSTPASSSEPKPAKPVSAEVSGKVRAAEKEPAKVKPTKSTPVEQDPAQQAPVEQAPVEQTPVEQAPKTKSAKPNERKKDSSKRKSTAIEKPVSEPVATADVKPKPVATPPPVSQSVAQTGPPPRPAEVPATAQSPAPEDPKADQAPQRRRRKKKNNVPFILGMLSIPLLATFIMLLARGTGGDAEVRKPRPSVPTVVPPVASSTRTPASKVATKSTGTTSPATSSGGYQLVSDGKFPWAPPYDAGTGQPSLELLPPGPAAVVSVRLGSLVTDAAGREILQALSPELTGLIKQAADRARVPVADIKRLTVALHPDRDGWPEASLAIELNEPQPLKALADTWQVSAARTPDGVTIYAGDEPESDAFFLGDSQKGALAPDATVSRFAVGSIKRIKAIAENEGGSIPMPRAMQKLWNGSSESAHVVVLVTPNFLFADGRELLATTAPELVRPLKQLLITDFAGLLVSLTAQKDVVYSELRAVPSGNVSAAALMRTLASAFETWPDWADAFSVDAMPERSWRLLANRLPQMMRFFVEHTRFGVEDDVVIANNYLPTPAASQFALATLLAMNTNPGEAVAMTATSGVMPLSVDEMLDRKMSISFDQLSLEFAINAVADEFAASLPDGSTMPEVRIIGSDLQKMGITQNQQIRDFTRKDIPLRTILTDIVLGANPDKTATGPNDPKQSLVWVVHDESGTTVILITTRVASEGKYELPSEFKSQ